MVLIDFFGYKTRIFLCDNFQHDWFHHLVPRLFERVVNPFPVAVNKIIIFHYEICNIILACNLHRIIVITTLHNTHCWVVLGLPVETTTVPQFGHE